MTPIREALETNNILRAADWPGNVRIHRKTVRDSDNPTVAANFNLQPAWL